LEERTKIARLSESDLAVLSNITRTMKYEE